MAIYLLAVVVLAVPLLLAAALAFMLYGWLRRVAALAAAELTATPRRVPPGGRVEVLARVRPRRAGRPVSVHATLTCTMFDHRPRRLFVRTLALAPVADSPGEYRAVLHVPENALRSGVVGDELSDLFSEEARHLLVSWNVTFEVRVNRRLAARVSHPVEVPEGRRLRADREYMSRLVVETFASIKDEMLLNWLVRLSAEDGAIADTERELLHELLLTTHNVNTPAEADARIAAELERHVDIDPELLRKHIPAEARVAFYRLLYAVAWRDGVMDKREHAFLVRALRQFGLGRSDVKDVELEVLREVAQVSMD